MDKSVSGFGSAVTFRANGIYHVPTIARFSNGFMGGVVNGWWAGTIVSAVSGLPFNPTVSNRSLSNNPTSSGAASDRPNLDPSFNLKKIIIGSQKNPTNWFNESMYDLPIAGTLGTAPRFGVRGPGLVDADASINKDTRARFLGEAGMVQLRAEVFNLANRPNFANPAAALFSSASPSMCGVSTLTCQFNVVGAAANPTLETPTPSAGKITSTNDRSRQIQISLKAIF
jgi:hypothetical protein